MAIISINASIGEGKDTFYSFFIKHSSINWENKKFAEKLKQIVVLLTGCKREDLENEEFKDSYLPEEWKTYKNIKFHGDSGIEYSNLMTYRELLQKLGTELLRNGIHQNVHINSLFADYNENKNWIITDLRFKNEFDSIKNREGITIKIIRYMSANDWLNSKYFNKIVIKNKQFIIDSFEEKSISKFEIINFIDNNKVNILQNVLDKNFNKLIHQSEIELNDYYNEGKFDYVLHNNSDLNTLETQIKNIVNDIETRLRKLD